MDQFEEKKFDFKLTPEQIERLKKVIGASPFFRLLGMQVENINEGGATVKLLKSNDTTHPGGVVHGGAIASLADVSVALAIIPLYPSGTKASTLELKINYFKAVQNENIKAESKIVYKGSRMGVGEVSITAENNNELLAKATVSYMLG